MQVQARGQVTVSWEPIVLLPDEQPLRSGG